MDRDKDVAAGTLPRSRRRRTASSNTISMDSSETQLKVVEAEECTVPRPRTHDGCQIEVDILEKHGKGCKKKKKQQVEILKRGNKHQLHDEDVQGSFLVVDRLAYDICRETNDQFEQTLPKSGVPSESLIKSSPKVNTVQPINVYDASIALPSKFSMRKSSLKPTNSEPNYVDDTHPFVRPSRKGTRLNEPEMFDAPVEAVRSKIERTPLLPQVGCTQVSFVNKMKNLAVQPFRSRSKKSVSSDNPAAPPSSRTSRTSSAERDSEVSNTTAIADKSPQGIQVFTSSSKTKSPFLDQCLVSSESGKKSSLNSGKSSLLHSSPLPPSSRTSRVSSVVDQCPVLSDNENKSSLNGDKSSLFHSPPPPPSSRTFRASSAAFAVQDSKVSNATAAAGKSSNDALVYTSSSETKSPFLDECLVPENEKKLPFNSGKSSVLFSSLPPSSCVSRVSSSVPTRHDSKVSNTIAATDKSSQTELVYTSSSKTKNPFLDECIVVSENEKKFPFNSGKSSLLYSCFPPPSRTSRVSSAVPTRYDSKVSNIIAPANKSSQTALVYTSSSKTKSPFLDESQITPEHENKSLNSGRSSLLHSTLPPTLPPSSRVSTKSSNTTAISDKPSQTLLVYRYSSKRETPLDELRSISSENNRKSLLKKPSSFKTLSPQVSFSSKNTYSSPAPNDSKIKSSQVIEVIASPTISSRPGSMVTPLASEKVFQDMCKPCWKDTTKKISTPQNRDSGAGTTTPQLTKTKHYTGDPCLLNPYPVGNFPFNQRPPSVVMTAQLAKRPVSTVAKSETWKEGKDESTMTSFINSAKPLSMLAEDIRETTEATGVIHENVVCKHNEDVRHEIFLVSLPTVKIPSIKVLGKVPSGKMFFSSDEEETTVAPVNDTYEQSLVSTEVDEHVTDDSSIQEEPKQEKSRGCFGRMFGKCSKKKRKQAKALSTVQAENPSFSGASRGKVSESSERRAGQPRTSEKGQFVRRNSSVRRSSFGSASVQGKRREGSSKL